MPIYNQYANSPVFNKYLANLQNALIVISDNETITWVNDYLSIQTANTDGLDNWGRILGQNRIVSAGDDFDYVLGITDPTTLNPNANIFDPNNDGVSYIENFNQGGFYSGDASDVVTLLDEPYRALLLLLYNKYSNNHSLGSINSIIKAYASATGRNDNEIAGTYCNESTGIMTIFYYFNFVLQPYEINLFKNNDILPRPSGVSLTFDWLSGNSITI